MTDQSDKQRVVTPTSPARGAAAITPSDSVNLDTFAKAIYVGVAGNIVIVTPEDDVVLFVGALAGSTIPVQAKRVNSTSTTATSLVALYS